MAGFRISAPARVDLEHILAVSFERWEEDGEARYLAVLEAGFRAIASDPEGPVTRDRGLLGAGLRSLHLRHTRRAGDVHDPVHVIYFRRGRSAWVEVVRILHERMDPADHVAAAKPARRAGKQRHG